MKYLTPNWNNIGDKLIYLGVQEKYPGGSPSFFYDAVPDVDEEIIVAGTPWLWDLCTSSEKYQYISRLKNKKKKIIGVGSCYSLLWTLSMDAIKPIFQHRDIASKLTSFWRKFELITVRDTLAKKVFDHLKIDSVLEPCPSSCVNLGVEPQEGEYDLYFIYNAATGISKDCVNLWYWDEISKRVVQENPGIKIVANHKSDLEYAKKLGFDAEYVGENNLRNMDTSCVKKMLEVISKAKTVISGRIHAAVPAIMMGKKTYVLPVDSRYLTCELLGGSYKGIWPGLNLMKLKNF